MTHESKESNKDKESIARLKASSHMKPRENLPITNPPEHMSSVNVLDLIDHNYVAGRIPIHNTDAK